MDAMIDIEGLDLRPRSHILSIGAVVFDNTTIHDKLYIKVASRGQQNRSVSASTALWWIGQALANPVAASAIVGEHGTSLPDALRELSIFLHGHATQNVWANGVDYDLVNLETAYEETMQPVPWGYRDRSDFRTVRKLVNQHGIPIDETQFEGAEHNALDDALYQARYLIAARKALGIV
jgi:hypothetical protein